MRLIDADALLEKAEQEQRFYGEEYDAMESGYLDEERALVKEAYRTMTDCVALINNAPTIDAVPVRHGEWIKTDDNICYARICSVCRKHVRVCIGLRCHDCDTEANYCPNCGARMDGKDGAECGSD